MSASSLKPLPQVDLSRVTPSIIRDNPDWDNERLATVMHGYLQFLQLCKTYPKQKISAPGDIDVVWHAHMLDSVHYMADCQDIFGYYLHHDPCIGTTDVDGAIETLSLYEQVFGTPPATWMSMMTCANPGGGCGSITALSA